MSCFHPKHAWLSYKINPSGKRGVVFNPANSLIGSELVLPCGRCDGCLLDRSRMWAVRCLHESKMYESNCFLTLSFDNEHLPKDGNVSVRDLQLFFKKFRREVGKVRYFACGEYGDNFGRPHYHVLMFGYDFPDKVPAGKSGEHALYSSVLLSSIWTSGLSWIGALTFESAGYVARYVVKKKFGGEMLQHYGRVSAETGEYFSVNPEFIVMSRRPGIGATWFAKFQSDVFGRDKFGVIDEVLVNGKRMRPPKYYDKLLDAVDSELCSFIKERRLDVPQSVVADRTPDRLAVREQVQQAKMKFLLRRFENDHATV